MSSSSITGVAWKFGDNVSTDLIAAGRYYYLRTNMPEFVKHVLEDADPAFAKESLKHEKTYIVVAGKNFGEGSSREHAPRLIKMAGTPAVLAETFARIFYRNCFNIGLPALIVDTTKIENGDELELNLSAGTVKDVTKNTVLKTGEIPEVMLKILNEGGIVEYIKKHGDLTF